MRGSRFTEEQIVAMLAEQERGVAAAEVCRRHGVSSATFDEWKARFGGMDELGQRACVIAVVLVAVHGDHRGLGVSRFDANSGQASIAQAIVEPLRQWARLETNPLERAIDPGQHSADVSGVRNRLGFKDHSAISIHHADAGHLE